MNAQNPAELHCFSCVQFEISLLRILGIIISDTEGLYLCGYRFRSAQKILIRSSINENVLLEFIQFILYLNNLQIEGIVHNLTVRFAGYRSASNIFLNSLMLDLPDRVCVK